MEITLVETGYVEDEAPQAHIDARVNTQESVIGVVSSGGTSVYAGSTNSSDVAINAAIADIQARISSNTEPFVLDSHLDGIWVSCRR